MELWMPKYYEFEIELLDIKPRIWRRFQINATSSFETLHKAIQDAFGWQHKHLYEFRHIQDTKSKSPVRRIVRCREAVILDEEKVPFSDELQISSIFAKNNDRCEYLYDFSGGWSHRVTLVNIVESDEQFTRKLVDGAMACPPEDCGGPIGFEQLFEYLGMTVDEVANLDDAERPEVEWLRNKYSDWKSDSFDLESTRIKFD
jgi:hypothetical protein